MRVFWKDQDGYQRQTEAKAVVFEPPRNSHKGYIIVYGEDEAFIKKLRPELHDDIEIVDP